MFKYPGLLQDIYKYTIWGKVLSIKTFQFWKIIKIIMYETDFKPLTTRLIYQHTCFILFWENI